MKTFKQTLLAAAASLVVAGTTHAAVLTTAALNSDGDPQHFHCSITNIGTKPVVVQNIEFINGDTGAVESSSGEFTVDPGFSPNNMNGEINVGYCRFTFKGSPKKVRAGMTILSADGTQAVLYIPAT